MIHYNLKNVKHVSLILALKLFNQLHPEDLIKQKKLILNNKKQILV